MGKSPETLTPALSSSPSPTLSTRPQAIGKAPPPKFAAAIGTDPGVATAPAHPSEPIPEALDLASNVGNAVTHWEAEAARRLEEILPHKTLERLLGDFAKTVRRLRVKDEGDDRRGSKLEMARALVVLHSLDLFANTAIREAVANYLKIMPPRRWVPGKSGARNFVHEARFPEELAGSVEEDHRNDEELIEPHISLSPLEAFQEETHQRLMAYLQREQGRCIVSLPTGAGKTRVAVESIREVLFLRKRQAVASNNTDGTHHERQLYVWVAHTEELCEQAFMCFAQVFQASQRSLRVLLVRAWGGFSKSLEQPLLESAELPVIVITTPQRLVNILHKRVEDRSTEAALIRDNVASVIMDEAHRAAAPTYRAIINDLGALRSKASVIGLTATPFRREYNADDSFEGTRDLKEIFEELVLPDKATRGELLPELQRMNVLARPISVDLRTDTPLKFAPGMHGRSDAVDLTAAEVDALDKSLLEQITKSPKVIWSRQYKLLGFIQEELARIHDALILYFGPTVADAHEMAYLLRSRGIRAASIDGNTRGATRKATIDRFRAKEVRVLCNCEVLTTGFDAPQVTHVIIGRPTVSRVLYEQMAGRALRGMKFGGTGHAYVVDCIDALAGPRPIFGYEQFRRVWKPQVEASAPAPASSASRPRSGTNPQFRGGR